jgi:hypothetical protein
MSEEKSDEKNPLALDQWYSIEWSADTIVRRVSPPGKSPWTDALNWTDIERICFEVKDDFTSDCVYIFTRGREESYAIPTEARGGPELWNEIIRRGLFDAKLAITAAASGGGVFCWPETDGLRLKDHI